jgi:hypothetical protein
LSNRITFGTKTKASGIFLLFQSGNKFQVSLKLKILSGLREKLGSYSNRLPSLTKSKERVELSTRSLFLQFHSLAFVKGIVYVA